MLYQEAQKAKELNKMRNRVKRNTNLSVKPGSTHVQAFEMNLSPEVNKKKVQMAYAIESPIQSHQ